jgi:hypothetical protein
MSRPGSSDVSSARAAGAPDREPEVAPGPRCEILERRETEVRGL